jgi:hypothetical protein
MLGAMLVVCIVSSLPCLAFKYLPMTDLPQHEAIVSIMRHMHDPAYGFEPYYDWAWDRTLYVLPYVVATGLSYLVPLHSALHITVFAATLSYPLGVLLTLRALRKPLVLTLLAVPLLYNRGFFWGFIHFNLGLGLGFIALSQMVGPWSRKGRWLLAGLSLLSATTHVYGLLLLSLYALMWLLAGGRRQLLVRLPWLLPAAIALGVWGLLAAKAVGFGGVQWSAFQVRLQEVGHSILGGYRDASESFILLGWVAVVLGLVWRSLPLTWGRWRRLGVHERVAYVLLMANLAAYFLLPVATATAKFISFRHVLLSAMLLPFVVSECDYARAPRFAKILPAVLAAAALANTGWHLWRFDREARDFDTILAMLPRRPRIAQMADDSAIMRSNAYMHFDAYGQAEHGGVLVDSFPLRFWNVPVRGRATARGVAASDHLEWPHAAGPSRDENGYDCFLLRDASGQLRGWMTYTEGGFTGGMGSWQLDCQMRRRRDPHAPSQGLDRLR